MSTLSEKVEELKRCIQSLECVVDILDGRWSKEMIEGGGTITGEIDCFDCTGVDVDQIIKSIINEHGSEECPHRG